MSNIGKNIKKIRTIKKLSQASFAEIFSLARPSVGAYEEGRAEPKIDTVIQIARYFGLSVDILLTRDLTINELLRFDSLRAMGKPERESDSTKKSKPDLPNVTLVKIDLYWDYIQDHSKSDFIDQLPKFHIPGLQTRAGRAFEMDNLSMEFEDAGILPGDILICERKIEDNHQLQAEGLYVFVCKDNIYVRRLADKNETIRLKADNPDWPIMEKNKEEIIEIWEVKLSLSHNLRPPRQYGKRLADMEQKLEFLFGKLNEKKS